METKLGSFLLSLSLLTCPLVAQEKGNPEKQASEIKEYVLVTSSLAPTIKPEAGRSVLVITAEEIKQLPVCSVEELLKYVAGFDGQQRGAAGIQVDSSLRGGTFEQTLIMIDGMKLTDPQTGHHSLNLPLSLEDIERIEILRGPGSRIFGPNALSGVVNIITRDDSQRSTSLKLKSGQHGYRDAAAGFNFNLGALRNTVSLTARSSDGYIENTDFKHFVCRHHLRYDFSSGRAAFQAGYLEKSFGANGFYSASFPNQWEKVRVLFIAAESMISTKSVILRPKIYLRTGKDEFLLDRNNPGFYENIHHSRAAGAEIKFSHFSLLGETSTGIEWRSEYINSNRLDRHKRDTAGIFIEHKAKWSRFIFLLGGVAYRYPLYGWKTWPGIEVNYKYNENFSHYASFNQSFRLPSFTELYYTDPANMGNPQLKPEETWEAETGLRYAGRHLTLEAAVFFRQSFNLIDWVRSSISAPWRAENVTEIITRGGEVSFTAGRGLLQAISVLSNFKLSFVFYDLRKNQTGYLSKYAFSGLKQQLIIFLHTKEYARLRISLTGRYFERLNQKGTMVVDGRLSWSAKNLAFFVEATNLNNQFYYDAGFLPAPGRWVYAGVWVRL